MTIAAKRDFSKRTVRALARRGISVIGVQGLPDMSSVMPYANLERGYLLDDNGTARVLRFRDVITLAEQ